MEYGSDFHIDLGELIPAENTVYKFLDGLHMQLYDSGRSALRHLLPSVPHETVALPSYLCDSILSCFRGAKTYFYSVNERLQADRLEEMPWEKLDLFYLLHYFGSTQDASTLQYIAQKKAQYGFFVIEDTTHSIFTRKRSLGDYCVCSLRKWFPIPDGGVLYSRDPLPEGSYDGLRSACSDRIFGMALKTLYLRGALDCKPLFRKMLLEAEEKLDQQTEAFKMSAVAEMILRCTDVDRMIECRKTNHGVLRSLIGDVLPEPLQRTGTDEVPYAYVVSLNRRDELRNYLIQNNVYCAVHWPCPNEIAGPYRELSDSLMSIPIDQRYNENDMKTIAGMIRGFFNE